MRVAKAVVCLLLAVYGHAVAETFDRGQALYENHCRVCHDESAHSRETSRAASIADLRKWVATWSFHASLDWSAEEIEDVVEYMDRRYYHFRAQP